MCRTGATRIFPAGILTAALLSWLAATGCNKNCVSFTFNPPAGTLQIKASDSKVTCKLNAVNGTVQVQMGASPMPGPTLGRSSARHIFISLRGIEAHPSTVADDDSSEWQELAPRLARQPVQVDLLALLDPCADGPLGQSDLPAGLYRQIRLSLLANQPGTGEPVPEVNACGSVGFHCIVRADGTVQSLLLDGGVRQVRIGSQQIAGRSIVVLPDTSNHIAIEFDPRVSLALPAGDGVRLVPALTAARRPACESIDRSQP